MRFFIIISDITIQISDKTVDSSTVGILLQESKKLLHAFSSRSDYNGVLPQAYAEVNKLYQTLTEVRGALVFIHLTSS